jgi:PAS domain S-box-containing protein
LYPDKKYRNFVWKNIKQALGGKKQDYTEFIITCKDKSTRVVNFHTSFFDRGLIIQLIDITERKKAEEALRISEEKYRSLVDNVSEGIIVTQDRMIKFLNPRVIEVGGYSEKELASRPFIEFIHPEDRKRMMEYYLKRLKGKEAPNIYSFRIVDKRGNARWIENKVVLSTWNNKPAALSLISDITERKRAEEEIEGQQKMLKQFSRRILAVREEEKKNFSNNLHDEIGSMVISLGSNLLIAEEQIKDNDLQGALKSLNKNRDLLKEAARNLKKIARNVRPPNLDKASLQKALRELFLAASRETGLKIDFSSNIRHRKLHSDLKTALYRITQEALSNIVTHADARKVKVGLYFQKNRLKFKIFDDGKGFDSKKSLQKTKNVRIGIRGMEGRIEHLGGAFTIKTAPKRGTKISITLPLRRGEGG